MASLPTGQREQTLMAICLVAVVAIGAYWYFPYQKKSTALEEQRARLEKLVEENQRARTELAKGSVESLRTELKLAEENLELLRTLIPTSNEVPALLEQVSTAARHEGLDLAAVDPLPVVEGEQYDTYRYDIGVVGGYHSLASFLSNVGGLTRIIAPVNVKLLPPSPGGSVRAQMNAKGKSRALPSEAPIEARFQIQTSVSRRAPLDEGAPLPITGTGARE
jgi:type IV pilus assembly protein PilO